MTTLIALLLRLVLLAAFVFCFVVFFEHGSANFGDSAKKEWETFVGFVSKKTSQQDEPVATPTPTPEPVVAEPTPPPAATPEPTPTPQKPPSAWEALQNKPIGEGIDDPIGGTPAPTP